MFLFSWTVQEAALLLAVPSLPLTLYHKQGKVCHAIAHKRSHM